MGRDVFVCLERRYTSSGTWELLAENVHIERHSTLFALLGAARGSAGRDVTLPHVQDVTLPHVQTVLPSDLSYEAEIAFARWEKGDDGQPDDTDLNTVKTQDSDYGSLSYAAIAGVQQIFSATEDDIYEVREIAAHDDVPAHARCEARKRSRRY